MFSSFPCRRLRPQCRVTESAHQTKPALARRLLLPITSPTLATTYCTHGAPLELNESPVPKPDDTNTQSVDQQNQARLQADCFVWWQRLAAWAKVHHRGPPYMTPTRPRRLPTRTIHDILHTSTSTQIIYGPFRTPSVASGAQAVNRSSTAALAFLVWDILITFDDEVRHVWPQPWNYTKCIYFLVRYVPVAVEASLFCIGTEFTPVFNFTPHDCFIWQVYQATAVTLIITAVDTVLILRVCALFINSPVVYVVKVGFVAEIVGMIIGLVLAVPKIEYDDVCLVTHVPKSLALWLTSLLFQALLFSLTAYRFYYTARADVPLMTLLMRDGTWAFLLLFLIYLGYAILLIIAHPSFSGVLYCWLVAAFSFSGYRIILNLLTFGATHRRARPPSHHMRQTSIDIQFTSHHLSTAPAGTYDLNVDVYCEDRWADTRDLRVPA